MCYLTEEVVINTVNNQVMSLGIYASFLEEEYEELSPKELAAYLNDLARALKNRS